MPPDKYIHRNHDRQEFKTAKVSLVGTQIVHQPLCGLCQPEDRPEVHSECSDHSRSGELLECAGRGVVRFDEEHDECDDKEEEGDYLKCETSEEDVVRCRWILAV